MSGRRLAALGALTAMLMATASCGSAGGGPAVDSPPPVVATTSTSVTAATATTETATSTTSTSKTAAAPGAPGTDQEVEFVVGGVTVHGSLRMPVGVNGPVPAAVLLAGSGPTDRNGNNPGEPGNIDTLSSLADALAADGVASLRYDKLTTGATGFGPFRDPARIGYVDFVAEAQGALGFLAQRPGMDLGKLMLVGHSEGALIALSAVAHPAAGQPKVAGLALLEGPGSRYLDLVSAQLLAALPQLIASGKLTKAQADAVETVLPTAVSTLRTTGSFPAGLPLLLQQQGFGPANAHFLQQADQADPSVLARGLPAGLPVLTSCSHLDTQVPCSEVQKVDRVLPPAALTAVVLTRADHVLKDVSAAPVASIDDLHFSSELTGRLTTWLTSIGFSRPRG